MASGSPNYISVQIARGYYQFKVENSKTKKIGIGEFVTTPKFSAGGHNWLIRYYPHGSDANNKGTYISLNLQLLTTSTSMSVTAEYELGILNKYGRPTAESLMRSTDTFNGKQSWNYTSFMKRSDLESDYIRDEYFIVVCSIMINEPCVLKNCSIGVCPFNLAEDLGALLEGQEETDVTFKVEGENISAHRLILASRSPVFKTELFGQMIERNCKCIEIDDMKALVFRAMLHFMYTDFVPDIDVLVSGGTLDMNMSAAILYQHLLVAADRYALEGLKTLCVERLCRLISIETVVSSLSVAEQHNCNDLKKICLEFISKPKNFVPVALSKEYASLASTCPSLLDELRGKVNCAADHK